MREARLAKRESINFSDFLPERKDVASASDEEIEKAWEKILSLPPKPMKGTEFERAIENSIHYIQEGLETEDCKEISKALCDIVETLGYSKEADEVRSFYDVLPTYIEPYDTEISLLDLDYSELKHMAIEKAEEIVSKMDKKNWLEDIHQEIDGVKYSIYVVDEGDWEDCGKYQYRTDTGLLCTIDDDDNMVAYDIAVVQNITRSGSYFTDYYYEFDPMDTYEVVEQTIPEKVIPERIAIMLA